MNPRPSSVVASALLGLVLLSGCTSTEATPTSDAQKLTVTATDTTCTVSPTTVPAGTVTFAVTNGGSVVTEFYVYAADGTTVIAEVEDIGPGLSRDLVVPAEAGTYVTACKPGMVGDGIRGTLTVTDAG